MSDATNSGEDMEKFFTPLTIGVLVDQLSKLGDGARSAEVYVMVGSRKLPLSCSTSGVLNGGIFTIELSQVLVKMGTEVSA